MELSTVSLYQSNSVISERIETEGSQFSFTSVIINHTKGHACVQKIYPITMIITCIVTSPLL